MQDQEIVLVPLSTMELNFDVTTYFIEDEEECYIAPETNMSRGRMFANSFIMNNFLMKKEFQFDKSICRWIKNGRRYVVYA